MKHLRVFGNKTVAYVPREKRDKQDSKAQELTFIAYDENIKEYRLIDPRTKKVTVNRNVIFRESNHNGISEECREVSEVTYQLPEESQEHRRNSLDINSSDGENDEDENEENVVPETEENAQEAEESVEEMQTGKTHEPRPQQSELRRSERKWKPVSRPGFESYMALEESTPDSNTIEEALELVQNARNR